jgi:predicted O-methyltransferase YrrM
MSKKTARPYSKASIAAAYLTYYFKAKKRHGTHSPAVYSFVENVVSKAYRSKNKSIERERIRLKNSKQTIDFTDFGKEGNIFKKEVSEIAKNSLKSKKYATLLSQLVKYYKASKVLELGTSLGITTAYLAQNKDVEVTSLEGDPTVAKIAQSVWDHLGLTNIKSTIGNFDVTLDSIGDTKFDIIYLDGNHKLEPTLRYFNQLQKNASQSTLFILDDIHYSKQMEEAWKQVKAMSNVTVTIDLFFLGIVFIDSSLSKQDFVIRY